jgi:hypothetical protein
VLLLIHCYERQLQHLARRDSDATARTQLLAAATRDLQPIITGPENRWPDVWTSLERDTALALARLHVRFSGSPSPYAERLLRAALRGDRGPSEVGKENAWNSRASLLLIEALAQNEKAAEARATVDQLSSPPIDALLDTLSALDTLPARDAPEPIEKRQLGELSLSLIALADSRSSQLDSASRARLDQWRASALAAAGNRSAALAHYAALAAASPDDGRIQERYAALLAGSDSPLELRDALARWQQVESRSSRGEARWRRARRARIELLTRLGEPAEADKLLRLTRLLYPDWDDGVLSP